MDLRAIAIGNRLKLIGGSHRGQGKAQRNCERAEFRLRELRKLLCGGNFFDDGLYGCARITGREDRAAHHDEIRTGTNRLGGRRGARLIIALR